ncbi:hypothetical protein ABZ517_16515 [Streptomyces scabiei]|uniref:hypothetical protein n=1 Tax=Streptomyces scabiei TaxID=1930 RepID=UPI0033F1BE5B
MGYRRERKVYNLVFGEGSEYEGLEVQAYSISVGALLEFQALQEKVKDEDFESIEALLSKFTKSLKEWNLEDEDGTPIPITDESVKDQDLGFVLTLIEHWLEAVGSVAKDLGKASNSGATSVEERLPMEAMS